MKAIKYTALVLGIFTILLIASWFLRDTIIERLSNSLLAQFDLTVTDVSLDALATSDASISYLELEHANGTVIAINDLRLPIRAASTGIRHSAASKITIELPADGDSEPLDLARTINQLLALPPQLPQSSIVVGEISVSPYPAIRDVQWELTENDQRLTALIETLALTANISRVSDASYSLDLSYADPGSTTPARSITLNIDQAAEGITFSGASTVDLAIWRPVTTLLGIDQIDVESGSADLRIEAEISNEPDQAAMVFADFTPATPVYLSYTRAPNAITSITVESASTVEISVTYPDLQWTLRQAQTSLRVSDGDLSDIPVSLVNLSCQSGTTCSADVSIVMNDAVLPFADVGRFEFAGTQDVIIGANESQILIRPDASVELSGISGPDLDLARFSGRLASTAGLDVHDAGWQLTAQSAEVEIEEFIVADGLGFSAQVFLDDIAFANDDQQSSAKIGAYASSSRAHLDDQTIHLPGFKGGIARQGNEVAVFLETVGFFEEAGVEASHNLGSDVGKLSLTHAGLSFDSQQLSSRVTPWPNDWNISAGTLHVDLDTTWQRQGTEWQVTAQTVVQLADLAGAWKDTAFAGLSTDINAELNIDGDITVQPSTLEIALVEMGLPVENISADYTLHPAEQAVDVENLHMTAFGGVITAGPFSFSTANERNTLLLKAESIDLAEILSINEFEAVEISGSIGAEIPVTIEGQTVQVEGGTLTGEPPGGVIRYLPGIGADQADLSGIGIATRALSNFEYETLTSVVDYTTEGDLNLQMRLTGRNPDLEENRPVILNFGLENNIPQMLRSLQAARAVEEILERQLAQ